MRGLSHNPWSPNDPALPGYEPPARRPLPPMDSEIGCSDVFFLMRKAQDRAEAQAKLNNQLKAKCPPTDPGLPSTQK